MTDSNAVLESIRNAWLFRREQVLGNPSGAIRLFNGFHEGYPALSISLYAGTMVIEIFHQKDAPDDELLESILGFYKKEIPFLKTALLKNRHSQDDEEKRGTFLFGSRPDTEVTEWDIPYQIDLRLNQDSSFYLDSANLRKWLKEHSEGKKVLNTFAYTGTFGTAALAGGASYVLQTDLNDRFMGLAQATAEESKIDPSRYQLRADDFFKVCGDLRRNDKLFDIVILDPPFFSVTRRGRVDQMQNMVGLINKIRPLAGDEGKIVIICNAIFLSGKDFLEQIQDICKDGYLSVDTTIPVPDSFFGPKLNAAAFPADPAPFNFPTKIVILNVSRKDKRKAE